VPVLGDAEPLILPTDDIAVDILQKNKGNFPPVAKLDKLGGFERTIGKEDAVVPRMLQDSHGYKQNRKPGSAVKFFELQKLAAIHHAAMISRQSYGAFRSG